ncbi:MAG: peptide deformylase [Acidimicrobiia bacterium]|nr:peptide deformylase [Acidimicrobiia bacterium]
MAVFPIRTWGDLVLTSVAEPVDTIDESLDRLIEDMLDTMYDAPGVGLAAPQIGVPRRVFVFDVGEGPNAVINPELVETSGEWEFDEGCLSVPGRYWPIVRPNYAKVSGLDGDGNEVVHEGDELLGRVLQHEIDHLDGMLLLKRLGRSVRKEALRALREEAMGLPSE